MSKMLTNKQIHAIENLDYETIIQILDICIERLGIVSADEYIQATGIKRSTLYFKMNEGSIKFIQISKHKLPILNL
jgi:DNA invertase Pin-like site-specific DNA recombinase